MTHPFRSFLSICLLLSFSTPCCNPFGTQFQLNADDPKKVDEPTKVEWNVETPPGESFDQAIDVTEGTWMNLDVSPDGLHIVFDLLGDIYLMPITGADGKNGQHPVRLTEGIAWDMQPRFSPDGATIAFTSDRSGSNHRGGDNVWIMDRDGSNPKQVTSETYRLVNGPTWSPDGQYLVARKHFSSRRSLGSGELWMYHRNASDANAAGGMQLTKKPNDQKDVNEPAFSRDGKYVYYSQDATPGDTFEYDKDSNKQIYIIKRLELATGKTENFIVGPGGACRPLPSPDDRTIAFVRRVGAKTGLHLYDVDSGRIRLVYDELERDMQEAWAIHGVYSNFAWLPDGQSLVLWAKGHIRRISIGDGSHEVIPFHIQDARTMRRAVRFPVEVAPDQFDVKMLRWVQTHPHGGQVAYQALGYLYLRDLPDGEPRRLTDQSDHLEFYGSYSSDGKYIVYSTWDDEKLGSIRVASTDPQARESWIVTQQPGHYLEPTFSPDGEQIVFVKSSDGYLRSPLWSREPGLYRIPVRGGEAVKLCDSGSSPHFANDSDRVYYLDSNPNKDADNLGLYSIAMDGKANRQHYNSQWGTAFRVSPNGKWVAFVERFNVYLTPMVHTGSTIEVGPGATNLPVAKVSAEAGDFVHFSGDSHSLHWSLGPTYFSRPLDRSFSFLRDSSAEENRESQENEEPSQQSIGMVVDASKPNTNFALVGAKIVTMGEAGVIKNGTIVVEGNRIVAVGKKNEVEVPEGAIVIKVPGMVVMPGLIDTHAHGPLESSGITPESNWVNYARLAFGVTTIHDPSNDTHGTFAASEMARAGHTLAPRTFSTGTILYGASGSFRAEIDSLDDARFHLRRMKAVGAFSVKSYNQPRRDQRQQVVAAARELEMMVVPEGGSTFMHNMTMIVDGHTGIEHTLPVQTAYDDVMDLWRGTEVGYTPTLCVAYGGISGERYWYQHDELWTHERLNQFIPRHLLHPKSRRRELAPLEDYNHIRVAEIAKQVIRDGGLVQTGGHGQLNGIDTHWELWSLVQGGMTPLESLQCGTILGAKYLGLDRDLGSVEVGKLADLIIIDRGHDPTQEIRDSQEIAMVMTNGRLFEAMTMKEIGGQENQPPNFFFHDPNQLGGSSLPRVRGCECSRPGGLPAWMIETN